MLQSQPQVAANEGNKACGTSVPQGSCDTQSRGLTSFTEGPFAKLERVPREAAGRGEAPGPAKAGSHDRPQVRGAEVQREGAGDGRERWVKEVYKLQDGD